MCYTDNTLDRCDFFFRILALYVIAITPPRRTEMIEIVNCRTGGSGNGATVDPDGWPADPRRPDGRRERSQASAVGRRQVRGLHDETRCSPQEPRHGAQLLRTRPSGQSSVENSVMCWRRRRCVVTNTEVCARFSSLETSAIELKP